MHAEHAQAQQATTKKPRPTTAASEPIFSPSKKELLSSSFAADWSPTQDDHPVPPLPPPPQQQPVIYWCSTEVKNLSFPWKDETVLQSISVQIVILTKANKTELSYLDIIEGKDMDQDTLTEYQIFLIHQKYQILCITHHLAKENMNVWTWEKCCKTATTCGVRMGVSVTKHP